MPVSLSHVAGELQAVNDECALYLHRRTGETFLVLDDEARRAVDLEAGDLGGGLPEWERRALERVREVLASGDWLAMPTSFEIDDYGIVRDFCESVGDEGAQDRLFRAVRGSGAFRRFRDEVARLDLEDAWYAHRDRAYERLAARWLEDEGVPFESGRP